jgi:hypothetical protein
MTNWEADATVEVVVQDQSVPLPLVQPAKVVPPSRLTCTVAATLSSVKLTALMVEGFATL